MYYSILLTFRAEYSTEQHVLVLAPACWCNKYSATLLHSTCAADTWESCMLITPLINTCHTDKQSDNKADYIIVHDITLASNN